MLGEKSWLLLAPSREYLIFVNGAALRTCTCVRGYRMPDYNPAQNLLTQIAKMPIFSNRPGKN